MRCLSIVFLLFSYFIGYSQTPTISWQKTIGGSDFDSGRMIIQLANGDFVIGATSESGISGEKSEGSYGSYDLWIFRMTPTGQIVWQKNYGGSQWDDLSSIIPTNDGGFLVTCRSNSPVSGNKTAAHYGEFDVWVIKIDSSGMEEWQNSYGGSLNEVFVKALGLDDGTFVISAASSSPISGNKTIPSKGGSDYWVVHINENGTILNQFVFGGSGDDFITSVSKHSDSKLLLAGHSFSDISGDKGEDSFGSSDYWVLVTDMNGNVEKSKTIGGDSLEICSGAISLESEDIIVFGFTTSDVSGNKTSGVFGSSDYWFVKLDSNLNMVWDSVYGGVDSEEFVENTGIYFNPTGLILYGGLSFSDISGNKMLPRFDITLPGISSDIWVIGVNDNGSKVLEFVAGGTDGERIGSLIQTANNTLMVTGGSFSGSTGNKTESSRGSADVWTFELDFHLSIEKIQVDNSSLHAYPVPAKTVLNFAIPKKGVKSQISLMDISGRVVYSGVNAFGEDVTIDVSNFPPGVYVLSVKSDEFHYSRKVVIE